MPYTEIASWCSQVGVDLSAWETELMPVLSGTYISALEDYKQLNALPPYLTDEIHLEIRRDYLKRRVAALNAMRTNKDG